MLSRRLTRAPWILLAVLALAACRPAPATPAAEEAPVTEPTTEPVATTAAERPESVPSPLPPVEQVADPDATPTPLPDVARPARVEVPVAEIDAPVLIVAVDEEGYLPTPDEHAGFWALSAPLGADGNTVIVGHNRLLPRPVFHDLPRIEVGDEITLTDQFANEYHYAVSEVATFDVEGSQAEAERTLEYIDPELSERVTLVTCQPEGACTARLIVVAEPVDG